jgi:SAM-dependent methyltransferase
MSDIDKPYASIVRHYEECLEKHGDSHLGVDWPKIDDAQKRYRIMVEVARFARTSGEKYSILDFGCGAAHLYEFIEKNNLKQFSYKGIDISSKFISLCRQKYPNLYFEVVDALENQEGIPTSDFVVMNGVFTEKRELTFDAMWEYFRKLLAIVFEKTTVGLAFNVMSKHVDWERDDLFHLPHDLLAEFLTKNLTRNYIIRNDYGLYEYTVYLYK